MTQEWKDQQAALFNTGVGPFKTPELVLTEAVPGDLIEFQRGGGYRHWGVYVGDGFVVHVHIGTKNGLFDKAKKNGLIEKEKLVDVCSSDGCRVNNLVTLARHNGLGDKNTDQVTVRIALDKVGRQIDYHLLRNNCEIIATDCKYVKAFSGQVSFFGRLTSFMGQVFGGRAGREMIVASGRNNGWTDEELIDFFLDREVGYPS